MGSTQIGTFQVGPLNDTLPAPVQELGFSSLERLRAAGCSTQLAL